MPSPRPPGDNVKTVVQSSAVQSSAPDAIFVLTATSGPDRGKTFTLDGTQPSRVLVGQSPVCDLRLNDPEVSRRHLALEIRGGALRMQDLGSTNGTFVDRVKVLEAELSGDEMLRIGSTVLRVECHAAERACSPPDATGFGRVIGASLEMRRLYPLCAKLAASTVPVIIEGETGTGKEVLAESLHDAGPRASGPFIVFDCTAVPPNLLEAELFGHERGAFTGAVSARRGMFEQAHGGTLLIDEIGELDPPLQPKLLRAIERSEVRRIGSEQTIRVNVRVIAATRRDLDREVVAGRFRDDLFHRLAVARVELPPLRLRPGDISLLARSFWSELGGDPRALPSDALVRWEDYPWPGNVRELRNAVARLLALGELAAEHEARRVERTQGSVAPPDSTGGGGLGPPPSHPAADPIERVLALPFIQARERLVEEFEQRYVERLLAQHGGNVARAASASGIGRRYFQKLRARWTR
jgi:DNA-binding NtrC family response regulator